MCKLMVLTNGSKLTKGPKNIVNHACPLITHHDDDGFGWAAWGSQGAFGERMLDPSGGYQFDLEPMRVKLPIVVDEYSQFGTRDRITGGVMFHGRTSTNHKTIINTHPIIRNGWTLVHNGVVTNKGPTYDMHTSNDTEHLVHYMSGKNGIRDVERHLTGYYAFAAFDPEGRLHVARDNKASLYVAWIGTLESYCFATTRDLIEDLCEAMKYACGPVDRVRDNTYMIFSGNEMIHCETIAPRGYDKIEASLMSKSLHYLDERVVTPSRGDSIDDFLDACLDLDSSCSITDEFDQPISLEAFRDLDDISKLACVVKMADGSILKMQDDQTYTKAV